LYCTTHTTQTPLPPRNFVFCIRLYFISTCFFVLIVLHFAFCIYLQHTTQTSMPPAGFEPPNPSRRAATGIGIMSEVSLMPPLNQVHLINESKSSFLCEA
jgi:hypothetical protein